MMVMTMTIEKEALYNVAATFLGSQVKVLTSPDKEVTGVVTDIAYNMNGEVSAYVQRIKEDGTPIGNWQGIHYLVIIRKPFLPVCKPNIRLDLIDDGEKLEESPVQDSQEKET